jgi:hypothetical protein
MKACFPSSIKASCVLFATTLSACGGGGSMRYTPPAPPSSTTTARFAQPAASYVSNASGGTIDRISLDNDAQTTFTEIASGFCRTGSPRMVFGPAGLTYDPSNDTLYVVDTSSASMIAIVGITGVSKDGLIVNGQCAGKPPTPVPTFSSPSMTSARAIAHGPPINTPLSAALLKNGDWWSPTRILASKRRAPRPIS